MINQGPGQYVVAGVDTFVDLLGKFIDIHDDKSCFDDDTYSKFLGNTINKYLFSYGTGLSYKHKRVSKNHKEKIVKSVHKIRERSFMKNTELYMDSGGFQVAMGAVKTEDMPKFINDYHDFLVEEKDYYDWAFCLDLPPGPGSADIFNTYNEIEELNRKSYQQTAALPEDVKKKMIYIHHFRSPSLYSTWNKFLFEENLGEGYDYYGTGGIVANLSSDMAIPVIIYTIPLSSILRYVKEQGKKSFKFHILGGANFSDVFYHKLFTYHIKKVHDIDIDITYDSSALFKGLAVGRFIQVMKNNGDLNKLDLRSGGLHLRFDDISGNDKVFELINDIADNYGFKNLNPIDDPIYDPIPRKSGAITFSRNVHMYLISHVLNIYREMELLSETVVKDIYPLYEADDVEGFDKLCLEFTRRLNQGKSTRKQKSKTYSLYKSLNILKDLDEDYNEFLVNKFMESSDISSMSGSGSLKF
jgi:hypothetical protein